MVTVGWIIVAPWGRERRRLLHYAATRAEFGTQGGIPVLRTLCTPVTINTVTDAGDSALHIACRAGLVSIARALLTLGVDYNIRNSAGSLALDEAKAHPEFASAGGGEVLRLMGGSPVQQSPEADGPSPPPRGSPAPTAQPLESAESAPSEIWFEKEANQSIGCTVEHMHLMSVALGSPAARGGAVKYIGYRLTHVNGRHVTTLPEASEASRNATSVRLRFCPSLRWRPAEPSELTVGQQLRLTRFVPRNGDARARTYQGLLGEVIHHDAPTGAVALKVVDGIEVLLKWDASGLDICTNLETMDADAAEVSWSSVSDYPTPDVKSPLIDLFPFTTEELRLGKHPVTGEPRIWVQGDRDEAVGKMISAPPDALEGTDTIDPLWLREQLSKESAESAALLWGMLQLAFPAMRAASAAPSAATKQRPQSRPPPRDQPHPPPRDRFPPAATLPAAKPHACAALPAPLPMPLQPDAAAAAAAATGMFHPQAIAERRVDPADGNPYTREQFIAFYRGTAEWERGIRLPPGMYMPRAGQPLAPMGAFGFGSAPTAGQPGCAHQPAGIRQPAPQLHSYPRGSGVRRTVRVRRSTAHQKVGWTVRNDDLTILEVEPNSPAAAAGIVPMMRLLALNDTVLTSVAGVRSALLNAGTEFDAVVEQTPTPTATGGRAAQSSESTPVAPPAPTPTPTPTAAAAAADGSVVMRMTKAEMEKMGTVFNDESTLILRQVDPGSAADRCGLRRMVGRLLTHVNGRPVASARDIRQIVFGKTSVELIWSPQSAVPHHSAAAPRAPAAGAATPPPPPPPPQAAPQPAPPTPGGGPAPASPPACPADAAAAAECAAVPVLRVETPLRQQSCSGLYSIAPGSLVNGFPVWAHACRNRWIYSSARGSWYITDDKQDFVRGQGFIFSAAQHGGRPPHRIERWLTKAQTLDPEVRVLPESSIPEQLELIAPQRASHCGGTYSLVPPVEPAAAGPDGQHSMYKWAVVNGMPVWKHNVKQRWLYSSARGSWYVTDQTEDFERGRGFIFSKRAHGGMLPPSIPMWQTKGQMDDPSICILAVSIKAAGPSAPASAPCGSPAAAPNAQPQRPQPGSPPVLQPATGPIVPGQTVTFADGRFVPGMQAQVQDGMAKVRLSEAGTAPTSQPGLVPPQHTDERAGTAATSGGGVASSSAPSAEPASPFAPGVRVRMRQYVTLTHSGLRVPAGAVGSVVQMRSPGTVHVLMCGAHFDVPHAALIPLGPRSFRKGDVVVPSGDSGEWTCGVVVTDIDGVSLVGVQTGAGATVHARADELRHEQFTVGQKVRVKKMVTDFWQVGMVRSVLPTGRCVCALDDRSRSSGAGGTAKYRFIESLGAPRTVTKDVVMVVAANAPVPLKSGSGLTRTLVVTRQGVGDKVGWTVRNDDLVVTNVFVGFPAHHAGVREGMRLMRLGGTPVRTVSEMLSVLGSAGKSFPVEVELPEPELEPRLDILRLSAQERQARQALARHCTTRLQYEADRADTQLHWLRLEHAQRDTVELVKNHPAARMGTVFRDEHTLVLSRVDPGTAAAECGVGAFMHRRLTHINGAPVYTCDNVRTASTDTLVMKLCFERLSLCPADTGMHLEQAPSGVHCDECGAFGCSMRHSAGRAHSVCPDCHRSLLPWPLPDLQGAPSHSQSGLPLGWNSGAQSSLPPPPPPPPPPPQQPPPQPLPQQQQERLPQPQQPQQPLPHGSVWAPHPEDPDDHLEDFDLPAGPPSSCGGQGLLGALRQAAAEHAPAAESPRAAPNGVHGWGPWAPVAPPQSPPHCSPPAVQPDWGVQQDAPQPDWGVRQDAPQRADSPEQVPSPPGAANPSSPSFVDGDLELQAMLAHLDGIAPLSAAAVRAAGGAGGGSAVTRTGVTGAGLGPQLC